MVTLTSINIFKYPAKYNLKLTLATNTWHWQDIAFLTTMKVSSPNPPPTHKHTVLYQPSQEGLIIVFHCLAFSKTDLSVKVCDRWKHGEGIHFATYPTKSVSTSPDSHYASTHPKHMQHLFNGCLSPSNVTKLLLSKQDFPKWWWKVT